MAESQSSSSSCSDRDSLASTEKNILNRGHNAPDMETASVDEDAECRPLPKTDGPHVMDSLPVNAKEHDSNEMKHPKTIKNIMVALKEGKNRENSSPLRSHHAKPSSASNQRMIIEASPRVTKQPNLVIYGPKGNAEAPAKTNSESNKRAPGMPSLKHQVRKAFFHSLVFLLPLPSTETGLYSCWPTSVATCCGNPSKDQG